MFCFVRGWRRMFREKLLMVFPKPCKVCDKTFTPTGRFARLCEECWKESMATTHRKNAMRFLNKKKPTPLNRKSYTKQYYCEEHNEGFVYQMNYQQHLSKVHKQSRRERGTTKNAQENK